MLYEVQVKNFFLFRRKVMFSRYLSFCIFNHPIINQIFVVMMNISTWQGAFLNIYLLNHNSLSRETWPLIDINKGNNFQEFFEQFGGLGQSSFQFRSFSKVFFSLANCSNYSITNYVKIPVFHFFEKVNKGQLKMVNVNY